MASAHAQAPEVERWQGAQGGPPKAHIVVIENASDWRAVWSLYRKGEVPPPFESARHMGLAVALGRKPSTGYGVELVFAGPKDGRFLVELKEITPGDQAVGQAMTSPWLILRFDRINLPLKVTGLDVAGFKR